MSLFAKILNEKLKKRGLDVEVDETSNTNSSVFREQTDIGVDLLRWLNSSPLGQKYYYKVDDSSYSIYMKDPKEIERQRLQREKEAFDEFLKSIPSEKEKESVLFFYTHGARSFMSFQMVDLKKDYRKLAFKFHPDRHPHETPSVKRHLEENFRVLSQSYETLQLLFSRAKIT
jgi:hypothetical protein